MKIICAVCKTPRGTKHFSFELKQQSRTVGHVCDMCYKSYMRSKVKKGDLAGMSIKEIKMAGAD